MYVNYVNDRKRLGYKVVKDTNDITKLVLIYDSIVLPIRNISLNLKVKIIVVVISLTMVVWFSNLKPVSAIGLPMPPAPLVRVPPSHHYDSKVPIAKIAKVIPRKKDIIVYKSPEEISYLIYLTDRRLLSNQEVLKLVKELRGGSWGFVGTGVVLVLIILIFSTGEGFVSNNPNPGWGLGRPNPFQPPTAKQKHPRAYDLFFPRRTCYANRPGGSLMMTGVNPQSSREELTQLSTDVVPTQTQLSGFVINGKINLDKCLNEVNRRASEIGCTDFECSRERFKALATENGEFTNSTIREAITILEGEMYGYYKDARRENYGIDVNGPDFIVEGIGEFSKITHVEVKNPVGSAIKIANGQKGSISKQGKKIGAKIVYQQRFWSNSTKVSKLENVDPNASFPETPSNVLGLVDNFDVPVHEKASMQGSILKGYNKTENIIFLNNVTNI